MNLQIASKPMMTHRPIAAIALAWFAAACTTTHEVDLREYFQTRGLQVTQNEAPPGAQPLELISFYKAGFYLFGVLPIVSVKLEDAIDWVTWSAERLGADGIANLTFQYSPASFWKFAIFPLPDWSSSIQVSGMAYTLPEGEGSGEVHSETPVGSPETTAPRGG